MRLARPILCPPRQSIRALSRVFRPPYRVELDPERTPARTSGQIVLYGADGEVALSVDLDAERDRERAVRLLAGVGPCAHGVWQHEGDCQTCGVLTFTFDGLFSRDAQ